MKHEHDRLRKGALRTIDRLRGAGHLAYLAGGCVRDMLLDRQPKDYDVATDAPPEKVATLFRRTRAVGAKFGVVLVGSGPPWIEVATFRTDLDYHDGRHPEAVRFSTPREDARRRDFTINGMFFDPRTDSVVDYVGGREDLQAGVIRAIGDPARRFAEDHLRMMRAVRFATRLGFRIEPATWAAIRAHAERIRQISDERTREELLATLIDPRRAEGIRLLIDSNLLRHVVPEIGESRPRLEAAQAVLQHLPPRISEPLALAALLHPIAPPPKAASEAAPAAEGADPATQAADPQQELHQICRRLRTSNHLRKAVTWLVEHHNRFDDPTSLSLGQLRLLMRERGFHSLTRLHEARAQAAGRCWENLLAWQALIGRVDPNNVAPPPLLTGHDLNEMGVPRGPIFKQVLDEVYLAQLDERIGTRRQALDMGKGLIADPPR